MLSVGRYQLLETLGEGGMGVVYKAFDPLIERTVAVKLIAARLDESPELRKRFFAEARAAGQLSHRNIVTIFDLGEDNGHPYFAMEFLEGRNLRVRIQSPELMSLDRKLEVMGQICEGLAYAHSKGITHRDIKPANVFITDSGQVKILDFGLARLPASELTHSKTLIGTLNYMAPEQIAGEKIDHRTDIFALGVVFYELLSSRSPFEADSVASLLNKILHEPPRPLVSVEGALPGQLSAMVERAMAKAREERYQTVNEFLVDLAACRAALRGTDSNWGPAGSQAGTGAGSGSVPVASDVAPVPPAATPVLVNPSSASGLTRVGSRPNLVLVTAGLCLGLLLSWTWFESHGAATVTNPGRVKTAAPAAQQAQPIGPPGAGAPAPQAPQQTAAKQEGPRSEARAAAGRAEGTTGAASLPPRRPSRVASPPDSAGQSAAESAREALEAARVGAAGANAGNLVPDTYAAALQTQAEAMELLRGRKFPEATVKLYAASGLYKRAENEARAEQARRIEDLRDRSQEVRPAPRPAPPPPAARPSMPAAGPAGEAANGTLAAPGGQQASSEAAVREVLSRYAAALAARDLNALKRAWPTISAPQERALREEFSNARSISVHLGEPVIRVAGPSAVATCSRDYSLDTLDGHHLESRNASTFALRRSGATWVIESVTHAPDASR